jgi:hypothetical protein
MENTEKIFTTFPSFVKDKGQSFFKDSHTNLMSNYYPLTLNKENQILYQFSISFEP